MAVTVRDVVIRVRVENLGTDGGPRGAGSTGGRGQGTSGRTTTRRAIRSQDRNLQTTLADRLKAERAALLAIRKTTTELKKFGDKLKEERQKMSRIRQTQRRDSRGRFAREEPAPIQPRSGGRTSNRRRRGRGRGSRSRFLEPGLPGRGLTDVLDEGTLNLLQSVRGDIDAAELSGSEAVNASLLFQGLREAQPPFSGETRRRSRPGESILNAFQQQVVQRQERQQGRFESQSNRLQTLLEELKDERALLFAQPRNPQADLEFARRAQARLAAFRTAQVTDPRVGVEVSERIRSAVRAEVNIQNRINESTIARAEATPQQDDDRQVREQAAAAMEKLAEVLRRETAEIGRGREAAAQAARDAEQARTAVGLD